MKRLLFLFVLVACGDSNVHVGGEVIVKHQIDVGSFEDYYRVYCESMYTTEAMVDMCVSDKMADLVASLIAAGLL